MCLRICTGFLKRLPSERRIYESTFGRTDQIALITRLQELNISGAFLSLDFPDQNIAAILQPEFGVCRDLARVLKNRP